MPFAFPFPQLRAMMNRRALLHPLMAILINVFGVRNAAAGGS